MRDALVSGPTDPDVLAEPAKGKIPALREALQGRFEAHHSLVIGAILAHLDFLDEQIIGLSEAIGEQLSPTGLAGVALVSTITGVAARTAEVLVAEIGTDMSVFPSAGAPRLLGRALSRQRPIGRQTPQRTDAQGLQVARDRAKKKPRWPRAAAKTPTSLPQHQRLKPRLGHGRALGAVKHSILIAYWHMFDTGETYNDLDGDYFARRDPERATKRLVSKLQALGHDVTLQPAAA